MKSKKCNYELSKDDCGTPQSKEAGDKMDKKDELVSKEETDAIKSISNNKDDNIEKRIESVSADGTVTKSDIKGSIKDAADKVAKVSVAAAKNVGNAIGTVSEDAQNGGGKRLFYTCIIASMIIFVLIVVGLLTFDSTEGVTGEVLVATSEDAAFLLDGEDMLQLVDDIPKDLSANKIIRAKDDRNFYIIKDAEMDEEYGKYIGVLVLKGVHGKEVEIDEDVVAGSLSIRGRIIWYIKADKDESILCCYNGRQHMEVARDKYLYSWKGTDVAGVAYYTTKENKDGEDKYESFYVTKNDSRSIMEDAKYLQISNDYKKALLLTMDDDKALKVFDGNKTFEVIDEVVNYYIDKDTFDMLVISDEEDRELYYIPYQKEEIEIDDGVENIAVMPYLTPWNVMGNDTGIDKIAYYVKEDNLYSINLKSFDTERIVKKVSELEIVTNDNENEFIYVDDDELVRFNYVSQKENTIELPDAENLVSSDVRVYKNLYVYRTEENKELFAYRGKHAPIELSNDAEEIDRFYIIFDGRYVIWVTNENELVLSHIKKNSEEEIGDDIHYFMTTEDKEIYFLSDYDKEEGGDLYYYKKVGADVVKVDKDIDGIDRFSYNK
jgi:hypothetical protein